MYLQKRRIGSMGRNMTPGYKPIYGYLRLVITKTVMCLVCVCSEWLSQYGRRRVLRLRGGVLGSLVCAFCRDAVALLMVEIDNIQNTISGLRFYYVCSIVGRLK